MIGLSAYPERTLVDRALDLLRVGPCGAPVLCREIMGLSNAPDLVAERLAVALLGADPRVRQLEDRRWAPVPEANGSPPLGDCAFAVVDVETTGMRAYGGDRITEIAIVVVQGNRREMVFESLINPGCPIPPRIATITGITGDMVRLAPPFEEVADQVLAALAGRVFVAHNARFDWRFVAAEVRRARALALAGPRICTVRLSRRLLPQLASRSLDSLMYFFGLENPARHRAGGDALTTADVLLRLMRLAWEQGARTLSEFESLGQRVKANMKQ